MSRLLSTPGPRSWVRVALLAALAITPGCVLEWTRHMTDAGGVASGQPGDAASTPSDGGLPSNETSPQDADACAQPGECEPTCNDACCRGAGAYVDLDLQRIIPTVVLVIDQSSSMDEPFGNSTRWLAIKEALIGPSGVIAELESQVRFGLALYSGDKNAPKTCPIVTDVAVELNNLAAIKALYQGASPISDTPTGDAIEKILTRLEPPARDRLAILLLATDGEPDTCEQPDALEGQQEAVDAVKHAYSLGIRTHVVAIGDVSAGSVTEEHARDLASAGLGLDSAQGSHWRASDATAVRSSFNSVIRNELSCDLEIEGDGARYMEGFCDQPGVSVTLDGKQLGCGVDWDLLDAKHLRLHGIACSRLKAGMQPSARFPCELML